MALLKLPLSLHAVQISIVEPALPGWLDTPWARVLLMAIGLQESGFRVRRQRGGPARGLWQFERDGGVRGVLRHPSSRGLARQFCAEAGVAADAQDCYDALAANDVLACQFARLLLYTDPAPLPRLGASQQAWEYYLRNWRPGRPRPDSWPDHYARARAALLARGEAA
ncbi:hypothetical protein [[Pseudomonas] boreopolis]|uniref:hypothetical protein n=1 Tax=Xanthomonas boreopolis TaxID=86183 RepID=UPI003DA10482